MTEHWIDFEDIDGSFTPWHNVLLRLTILTVNTALFLLFFATAFFAVMWFFTFTIDGRVPDTDWLWRGIFFALALGALGCAVRVIHAYFLARRWPTPAHYLRWVKDQKDSAEIQAAMDAADRAIDKALAMAYAPDGTIRRVHIKKKG